MTVIDTSIPPVVALGMEMGDGALIRRWCAEGRLPAFEKLLDEGSWAWLETTADSLHVSAWPSLYTGTGPARHGVYYTFQPRAGLQGYARFEAGIYGEPSFWCELGRSGKRCVVFDAPYTAPERGFDGVQIFDWGTWAQYLSTRSTPPKALKELRRHCGAYPLGLEAHDVGLVAWDPDDMEQRLVRSIAAKGRAIRWLMQRQRYDLFFAVFGETHPAAHYCWPERDGEPFEAPQLLRVYQALDRAVGEIAAQLGRDTVLFLISGDGVGPNRSGWHLLPEVLEKLGVFVKAKPPPKSVERADAGSKRRRDPVKAIRDLIPVDFRKALARRLPTRLRDSLARRVDTADIAWEKTRAFCLPTDLEGYIRVNLRGREPQGIVEPGAEYEALCHELATALRAVTNPATGRPAAREVIVTERALDGPRRDQLPDLVVCWSDEAEIAALESVAIGRVSGASPDGRTGTHKPPGFVLARNAVRRKIRLPERAHIFDFAPTLLAYFGVEPAVELEGRPWPTK